MAIFDRYSAYYDLYYKQKDYKGEAAYVSNEIRRVMPRAESILEIGCGTGAHATELVKDGYTVTGIDNSESMLKVADERLNALPELVRGKLKFLHGDARSVRLGSPCDAVISLFHVMSYQSKNIDLKSAFRSASENLGLGGVFAFDFWYGPCVLSVRPETRVYEIENEDVAITRIAQPEVMEQENCVLVKLTILVCEKNSGIQHKFTEVHKMRYLFLPEIDDYLERSGLERLSAMNWLTSHDLNASSWSGFVLAKKCFDC